VAYFPGCSGLALEPNQAKYKACCQILPDSRDIVLPKSDMKVLTYSPLLALCQLSSAMALFNATDDGLEKRQQGGVCRPLTAPESG
jgi:hypothetical protein